jgi:NTP pyrophosphatase (non-canonical NTP hydrolase)
MDDRSTTVDDLKAGVRRFTSARGWDPDARSLAISISIEAAELLEHFQWQRDAREGDRDEVAGELADVVVYCLQFAMALDLDVTEAITAKMARNAAKYPVELFTEEQDGTRNYYAAKEAARRAEPAGDDSVPRIDRAES